MFVLFFAQTKQEITVTSKDPFFTRNSFGFAFVALLFFTLQICFHYFLQEKEKERGGGGQRKRGEREREGGSVCPCVVFASNPYLKSKVVVANFPLSVGEMEGVLLREGRGDPPKCQGQFSAYQMQQLKIALSKFFGPHRVDNALEHLAIE